MEPRVVDLSGILLEPIAGAVTGAVVERHQGQKLVCSRYLW